MQKAISYGVATLTFLLALMFASTRPWEKEPIAEKVEKIPAQEEKFVAVQMAQVKWPAETKAPHPKPPAPPKQVRKNKRPTPPSQTAKRPGSGGKKRGGYNIVGAFQCSVTDYLAHMRQKQALVVVYDGTQKRLWELTPAGQTIPIDRLPRRFSPQSRRLTEDYPERSKVFAAVNAQYGPGSYEILLLIPEALDRRLTASLEAVVKQHVDISGLTAVHLTYRQKGTAFTATVDWGLANGRKVTIGQAIVI